MLRRGLTSATQMNIAAPNMLRFETVELHPYSPDLAPSDIHLLGSGIENFEGRFTSDMNVRDVCKKGFTTN
ncbi:hypothetical protein TNCV_29791 [Trichonephila clavipes]|nr:hypothetical protein TNCV_29791 [Trichonephila clavipes]